MKVILSLVIVLCFATLSYAGDLMSIFHERRVAFDQIRDEFSELRSAHPDLSHVDLEGYGPLTLKLDTKTFDSIRSKMKSCGAQSVVHGDFSGRDLKDTVYVVVEFRKLSDIGIQAGFVSTESKMEKRGKTEDISFTPIGDKWYLFERKFEYELY